MSARAIEVCAAVTVTDTDDKAAVLIKTGIAAFGLSIAEARFVAQRLARAADQVEYEIALRERLKNERADEARHEARYQSWSSRAADEAGKAEHGPL